MCWHRDLIFTPLLHHLPGVNAGVQMFKAPKSIQIPYQVGRVYIYIYILLYCYIPIPLYNPLLDEFPTVSRVKCVKEKIVRITEKNTARLPLNAIMSFRKKTQSGLVYHLSIL